MSAPPYSEPTEAAVIGACVLWPDRVLEGVIASGLRPEHFYVHAFGRAWEAVLELVTEGTPVDVHTLTGKLDAHDLAGKVDDRKAVAEAVTGVAEAMPSHAPEWARVVIRDARARAMLTPLRAALAAAQAGQVDEVLTLLHDVLDAAEVAEHVCH